MCGIAGIVYKHQNLLRDEIKIMTDTLAHRGPDGEGFYFGENFALGHRRLAIIDLSPLGHQPMIYKRGKEEYVIVFNGEIYNYIELREELRTYGYMFNTNTDTEVILAAYDMWGTECLKKFNGMWAFVIFDRRKNIFFGSRDRFGVKPFYYLNNNKVFAFASEIKALLKLPHQKLELEEEIIFDYLLLGYEEQDNSIFKGVYELYPSSAFILNLDDFSFREWRYYELAYVDKYEKFDEKQLWKYREEVKELIFNAVKLRLRSDVPVGSCLSGGLDSSTIVCVINEIIKKETVPQVGFKQNVFTATYTDKAVDESKYAEAVVKHTQTEWHQTYPTAENLINDLEDLIYYQEIPFGSTSIYAQYSVMRLAKEKGVKVLLDGQGGDELFTGYIGYYPVFYREILMNFDLKTFCNELKNIRNSPISIKNLTHIFIRNFVAHTIPDRLLAIFYLLLTNRAKYFNREFLSKFKYRIEKYVEELPKTLNQQLHQYITGKNLKTLLRYEDRNSMRFSIESRTPFADDINLIECLFKMPSTYKIHKGWSKYILREAMRGIIPEKIRLRTDKVGFATPEKNWLLSKRDFIEDILHSNNDLIKDYLSLNRLLKDYGSGKIFKEGFLLWRVINFIIWRNIYRV
ncbi:MULTISPECIES: asparagine synthase (glutamine-hydrolyzing) [Thermodesulfovibrio]|uniref:asparagine synthase (glutamine-hydrolyzing) n=1 Tax=Thermodesulfovibrio TaxID=28261 RepID=UPI0026249F6E|nr:asparagine synthase (glutamine-hydrolyzing) [Thermodesulfovibrio sp.]